MQKVKSILVAGAMMLGMVAAPLAVASTAGAIDPTAEITKGIKAAGSQTNASGLDANVKTIINVLLFIIGIAAVIMIVIGGLRYVISGGDSSHTKAAKDTIFYAVIGLVIAILAYAIVNFVVDAFVRR